jgi:cytosine/adenosine deaminase-related metal-dependent hydrolase
VSETITLVRAGHVLTMGPLGDIASGAVAISGELIVGVGPFADLSREYPDAQIVGDDYGIVIPGFVNAHTHMSEALIPGMAENLSIWVWGSRLLMPVMPHLTRGMARIGTLFRGAELIRSGVTTFNDMFCHANLSDFASLGVVDGLEELGLRGVVSFGAEDIAWGAAAALPVTRIVEEHRALAERAAASKRVCFRVGVGTILGQTDALLEASSELARSMGRGMHTHLAEVREEKTAAQVGKKHRRARQRHWDSWRKLCGRARSLAIAGRNRPDRGKESGDHLQSHRQHDPGIRSVPARSASGAGSRARDRHRWNGEQRQPKYD